MKEKTVLLMGLLALFLLASCGKEEAYGVADPLGDALETALLEQAGSRGLDFYRLPSSTSLHEIPQDPLNPLTPEKVALGKMLFHEAGLAMAPKNDRSMGTYSCASCHFAAAGFQAGRHQGIGEGGEGFGIRGEGRQAAAAYDAADLDVQPIRSPSALNSAYQEVMLWNGQFGATGPNAGTAYAWRAGTPIAVNHLGFQGLESQAIAGIDVHRLLPDRETLESLGYKELFDQAFPERPEAERYNKITAGLAMAAYERTLLANEAPFQQWLRGDQFALSELEKKGALLFFTKAECSSCHTGPALNNMDFYALGMKSLSDCPEEVFQAPADSPANLGRGGFTGRPEDAYKFKTPQLYNLKNSPFYGHGASFRSIREVVAYKNRGVGENPAVPASQLAEGFHPLGLADEEIDAITAFLEHALRDRNLKRFEPDAVFSGLCFPNNDGQSRQDMGCD